MATEPTNVEIIAKAISSRLLDVHTAIPAVVVSYDSAKQTCSARPVVRGPVPKGSDGWGQVDLPTIQNVPVGWHRGGGASIQFPLAAGDHVLLIFSEADFSGWRQTGQVSDAGDLARHDLSWPVAIPCAAPDSKPLRSVSAPHFEVPSGEALTVGGDPGGADFVALASLVHTELGKIANAFSTFVPGSGGASFPNPYVAPGSASAIASTSLKARKP